MLRADVPLVLNFALRDLIALAAALGTVEQTDGWQAVAPQVYLFNIDLSLPTHACQMEVRS